MKIINRKQFFELPDGIIYSKYNPCYFDGLYIRLEVIKNINGEPIDFYYKDLIAQLDVNDSEEYNDVLLEVEKTNGDIKLNFNCSLRDGFYDDDEMFAVYSREDIINLSNTIAGCIGV